MSRSYFSWAITAGLALGVSACDTLKEQAGLTKKVPDEFTIITKAPLVMPPDFSLRPPRPGAKGPRDVQPRDQARAAVFQTAKAGRATAEQARQAGQNSLAGATGSPSTAKAAGAEVKADAKVAKAKTKAKAKKVKAAAKAETKEMTTAVAPATK